MEGDSVYELRRFTPYRISIHSLRMEGDIYNFDNVFCVELFQSTPSAWRETGTLVAKKSTIAYFNPLPPHGGRLLLLTQ